MAHSTAGLLLYSNLTGGKIGTAVPAAAKIVRETETYYEYAQFVKFNIDYTEDYYTRYIRWRRPKPGYAFWQFSDIEDNNTRLVTVNCVHIMQELYPYIGLSRNFKHCARVGGVITNGQLQQAGVNLNVVVSKLSDGNYTLSVNNGQWLFQFNPDEMTPDNANEINFATE